MHEVLAVYGEGDRASYVRMVWAVDSRPQIHGSWGEDRDGVEDHGILARGEVGEARLSVAYSQEHICIPMREQTMFRDEPGSCCTVFTGWTSCLPALTFCHHPTP